MGGQPISEDMVAEGHLGLIEAARRFDRDRGIMFQTYAMHWVRAHVMMYLLRNHGPVRFDGQRAHRQVFFHLGRANRSVPDGDPVKLAAFIGVSVEVYESMLTRIKQHDVSIDDANAFLPLAQGGESVDELLGTDEQNRLRHRRLQRAMKCMDARMRYIIEQRFLRDEGRTLQDLGDELKLSRERVRQLEVRGLNLLKARLLKDKNFELAIGDFI